MPKESDSCLGVTAGMVKILGAATAVGMDKFFAPSLISDAGRLAAAGHNALANVEAEIYLTLHTPPELAWARWLGAAIVAATTAEQVKHPPGEKFGFWTAFAYLYGLSVMLEPNVLAVTHQHPELSGFSYFAWGLAAITLVEGARIGWNVISRSHEQSETKAATREPVREPVRITKKKKPTPPEITAETLVGKTPTQITDMAAPLDHKGWLRSIADNITRGHPGRRMRHLLEQPDSKPISADELKSAIGNITPEQRKGIQESAKNLKNLGPLP